MKRDSTARKPLKPFTVDHFRAYTALMVLDNGEFWPLQPFQAEIVADVFAGFPEVWAVIPEGNGKTSLMGGVALYHADFTESANCLVAASSREQAGILFGQAAGLVHRSPGFDKRFRVFEGYRRISALRTHGRIQVMSADDRTGDGAIPSLGILDELHRQQDLRLYRTWRGKLDKRGGQILGISTAGEPGGDFEVSRARMHADSTSSVTNGSHTRSASDHAVIHDWRVPDDADVEDMDVVKDANPLPTITPDKLGVRRKSPTMTDAHWRRFVCNQAVRSESTAISPLEWGQAVTDERPHPGEACVVGLDVGWKWDTTAIVPLFEREGFTLVGAPTVLVPPRDGTSLTPSAIHRALDALHSEHPVELVVLDGAAGGEQLEEWIGDRIGCDVVVHSNGHQAQALAFTRWMEALRAGELLHVGDDTLTTHVLNAQAKILPQGDARFDRTSSSRAAAMQDQRVIDCLTAASGALSVVIGRRLDPGPEDPFFEVVI